MDFDELFDMLKNRKQSYYPMSDTEVVDIIVKSYMDGSIDDEEKEMLIDLV